MLKRMPFFYAFLSPSMDPGLAILEYLDYVVMRLITKPEAAGVTHEERDGRHFFHIRVHPDDAGRVIGRNGRTIVAIRSLALASAEKLGLRITVDLEDPLADPA
jgi:predicted RNA-binding protein YlqC (UPF0109 family)